jgi:hypothetical protein
MKILSSHSDYQPTTNINLKCAMHIGQLCLDIGILHFKVRLLTIGDDVNFCSKLEDLLIMIKLSFLKS